THDFQTPVKSTTHHQKTLKSPDHSPSTTSHARIFPMPYGQRHRFNTGMRTGLRRASATAPRAQRISFLGQLPTGSEHR
ncbi:hypothetical protein, partial [Frankia sp. CcI49]|uniref:hypothetical protein n=1 Tax=Frankia sp. CcI49 TaxID=1745382 RepID=UPI001A7E11F1